MELSHLASATSYPCHIQEPTNHVIMIRFQYCHSVNISRRIEAGRRSILPAGDVGSTCQLQRPGRYSQSFILLTESRVIRTQSALPCGNKRYESAVRPWGVKQDKKEKQQTWDLVTSDIQHPQVDTLRTGGHTVSARSGSTASQLSHKMPWSLFSLSLPVDEGDVSRSHLQGGKW